MTDSPFITDPIAEGDPGAGFRCGKAPLDDFFAKYALPNDRRGLGRTFVLRSATRGPDILGYYTLCMADVDVAALPDKLRRGLPRYPLPVARIARLATDERARGRGHGAGLLADAFLRIDVAALTVGCYGIIVDAKDDEAVSFYARYGFVILDNRRFPKPMFLSLKVLRKALPAP